MQSRSNLCECGHGLDACNASGCRAKLLVQLPRLADDQKARIQRQWQKPTMAPVAQKPCDHGLFSDDAKQIDLLDLTQAPRR